MERLDKVILSRHPDFSRSRIEGLVKAGCVTVNGAVASNDSWPQNADDIAIVKAEIKRRKQDRQ